MNFWVYNKSFDPTTGETRAEYCSKNKDKKGRPRKVDPVAVVAGNGHFGFRTRKPSEGIVQVRDANGDLYNRHRRKTTCKRRKMTCQLATTAQQVGHNALQDKEIQSRRNIGKPRWRARKGQKICDCK